MTLVGLLPLWMGVKDAAMAPDLQGYQKGRAQLSPRVLVTSWLLAKVGKLRHKTCFIELSVFWVAEASRTLGLAPFSSPRQ